MIKIPTTVTEIEITYRNEIKAKRSSSYQRIRRLPMRSSKQIGAIR